MKKKVAIIGDSGVGKTSILHQYVYKRFIVNTVSTINVSNEIKEISTDNGTITLIIWDTAGQERYNAITKEFYRNSDGIILCFSLDNHDSFEKCGYWMDQIFDVCPRDTPIVLAGNKCDLKNRNVTEDEIEEFVKPYKCAYFFTSASTGECINDMFYHLGMRIQEKSTSVQTVEIVEKKEDKKSFNLC